VGVFDIPCRIGMVVAMLDEEPAVALVASRKTLSGLDQCEAAVQLLAVQDGVDAPGSDNSPCFTRDLFRPLVVA
jgi:hypothetical protein